MFLKGNQISKLGCQAFHTTLELRKIFIFLVKKVKYAGVHSETSETFSNGSS